MNKRPKAISRPPVSSVSADLHPFIQGPTMIQILLVSRCETHRIPSSRLTSRFSVGRWDLVFVNRLLIPTALVMRRPMRKLRQPVPSQLLRGDKVHVCCAYVLNIHRYRKLVQTYKIHLTEQFGMLVDACRPHVTQGSMRPLSS